MLQSPNTTSPSTTMSSPYSPAHNINHPEARFAKRRQTTTYGWNDECGLPSLDKIPSFNFAITTLGGGTPAARPHRQFARSDRVAHLPVMESVMHADKPMLLCKILSFVSCHDKAHNAMVTCKSWKLCVFNPLSYSVVKLDFLLESDCLICVQLSPMWFRLKLLVVMNPGAADPAVLICLLKHVQSIRAIWLKCAASSVSALDETFVVALMRVAGRSCEVIRLDRTFSVSIGQVLSESCRNLRQLILSGWTNDASLLGDVAALGLDGLTNLTSTAIGVENGTALHPLLLLLKEIGANNVFLERWTIQFGDAIDKFAKGMPVTSADGTVYDAWAVFERVFIDRLQKIASRFCGVSNSSMSVMGVHEVRRAKKLKVTFTFREHCVNILAFVHRVRSSIPDRTISVRIQRTRRVWSG